MGKVIWGTFREGSMMEVVVGHQRKEFRWAEVLKVWLG